MPSRADAAPAYLYAPDLGGVGAAVALSEDESHYLTRVCRARPGDAATATDGRGTLASLEITQIGRSAVARVVSREDRPRARRGWLLAGPPEGERADWMVEKLAELGLEAFQPIDCARAAWGRAERRHERWKRLAVAALKQSRRVHLMEIRPPLPLAAALATLPPEAGRWLARERGRAAARVAGRALEVGCIGPSSGLDERESGALEAAGFQPIALAEGRLRTETAALAWAAWWALPDPSAHPG